MVKVKEGFDFKGTFTEKNVCFPVITPYKFGLYADEDENDIEIFSEDHRSNT